MGSPDAPPAPNVAKDTQAFIDTYLKNIDDLLFSEQDYRNLLDPQRIEMQLGLQEKYGPAMYQQQLDALNQLDPESKAVRGELGSRVLSDLQAGYDMTPDYEREIEQGVRRAQASRGNILGNGPASVEASVKGKAAMDLYQQRLQNAGTFLSSPTPTQQLLAVSGVQPDRSSAYVSPGAFAQGAQYGLQNYSNLLAQHQLAGGGTNPWMTAATGAASGAAAGSAAGPWGAVIGGVVGGAAGYYSDSRLKHDVQEIVTTKGGIPIVRFSYLGSAKKFIGTLAHKIKELKPEAVGERNGFLTVDYSKLDVPFFELKGAT